ncbi:MAG: hypothetical protein WDN31_00895 [Hyphomicrobium sp.]
MTPLSSSVVGRDEKAASKAPAGLVGDAAPQSPARLHERLIGAFDFAFVKAPSAPCRRTRSASS